MWITDRKYKMGMEPAHSAGSIPVFEKKRLKIQSHIPGFDQVCFAEEFREE